MLGKMPWIHALFKGVSEKVLAVAKVIPRSLWVGWDIFSW